MRVWSTDSTSIRLAHGFCYLMAIMDWFSRYVLAWRRSKSLETHFCLEALEEALEQRKPASFNTDQGAQFTSVDFTSRLEQQGVRISMEGRGRALDHVFVDRLWRSVKWEEVYVHDYQTMQEAWHGLQRSFAFYNRERPHQALGYLTPDASLLSARAVCSRGNVFLCPAVERSPLMEVDWSEHSPPICTLVCPWQPGDGYEEAVIMAVEHRLGVRLLSTLRNFYLAWGQRRDLLDRCAVLLPLDSLVIRPDALIFCVENQGTWYWAILREALEVANPPIVFADAVPGQTFRQVEAKLAGLPSHTKLSTFLDDLTYEHARAGGAVHGGWTGTRPLRPHPHQIAWLEQRWNKATVTPSCFQFRPGYTGRVPTLYVRDGQVLTWSIACHVAVAEAGTLDEIGQALQITWDKRWY